MRAKDLQGGEEGSLFLEGPKIIWILAGGGGCFFQPGGGNCHRGLLRVVWEGGVSI